MSYYDIILRSEDSTVVTDYKSKGKRSDSYQSEHDLEQEFINILQSQCYEYLPIHNENDLIKNLRIKLEELNKYKFSDDEWDRFFNNNIVGKDEEIADKTRKIQEDYVQLLKCDDGQTKNIKLIDKSCIHNNKLQVINQYVENEGKYKNRYDVTVLVNGLPLVHIELKRRGVSLQEAFNQIKRYQRDSFWASKGLFKYIQIFVISNGTETKYYSNTTRNNHIKESNNNINNRKTSTSNSFEFTSYWTDANNNVIYDLVDFTKTFFAKHTILNILTKYCVFTVNNLLLVMRPYQIAATERIINRIEISNNYKTYGSIKAGGYIWHTTGSGKTLTSFKVSQLAIKFNYIDKVIFVVDRKDLDYQTMCEYDKFQKDAANSNTSTRILKQQLDSSSENKKLIVTTIQKLDRFIKKYTTHPIFNKHVVIIFDECHRSQFGDMHKAIIKNFKKYHLFGFTGTPIGNRNKNQNSTNILKTTKQIFGDELHTYNIVNAIQDHNVLPFKIQYLKTFDMKSNIKDKKVSDIDREKVWSDPRRISNNVKYILDNFREKTYGKEVYSYNAIDNINKVVSSRNNKIKPMYTSKTLNGFNSIFCVWSIDAAKQYYLEFKKQMEVDPLKKLNIATIFSYSPNEEGVDGIIEEENSESTLNLDKASRDFLEAAIQDYNNIFQTNFDTSSDKFQNYYRDVSYRMKNREIDILIVVNMFLTGFDATTLNTLWVDKNLRDHGLIQAFSRTNRILNSIKKYGNIICFRSLQKQVEESVAMFGDKNAIGICVLKSFKEYFFGYIDSNGKQILGYKDLVEQIKSEYPLSSLNKWKSGEQAEKDFVNLFSSILRARTILFTFDEFKENDILSARDLQDYQSIYLKYYDKWRKKYEGEAVDINDDLVFEIESLKQEEVGVDTILQMVSVHHKNNAKDETIELKISRAIDSSLELRSKKELIENFVATVNKTDNIFNAWEDYTSKSKYNELLEIINQYRLNKDKTIKYIDDSFKDGELKTTGMHIENILPPISIFKSGNKHYETRQKVIKRLKEYFEKYLGI